LKFFCFFSFQFQIEVLLEQQGILRNQVIEKEEDVERLLQGMDQFDDMKAENNQLKVRRWLKKLLIKRIRQL